MTSAEFLYVCMYVCVCIPSGEESLVQSHTIRFDLIRRLPVSMSYGTVGAIAVLASFP